MTPPSEETHLSSSALVCASGKVRFFLTDILLSAASIWDLNTHTHTQICQAPLIRPLLLASVSTPINQSNVFLKQTFFIWQEVPPPPCVCVCELTPEDLQVTFPSWSQRNFISGVTLPHQRLALPGNLTPPPPTHLLSVPGDLSQLSRNVTSKGPTVVHRPTTALKGTSYSK